MVFLARGLDGSSVINVRGSTESIVGTTPFESTPWHYGSTEGIGLAEPFTLEMTLESAQALEQLVLMVRYAFDPIE